MEQGGIYDLESLRDSFEDPDIEAVINSSFYELAGVLDDAFKRHAPRVPGMQPYTEDTRMFIQKKIYYIKSVRSKTFKSSNLI